MAGSTFPGGAYPAAYDNYETARVGTPTGFTVKLLLPGTNAGTPTMAGGPLIVRSTSAKSGGVANSPPQLILTIT